jgi:hypothetical protein
VKWGGNQFVQAALFSPELELGSTRPRAADVPVGVERGPPEVIGAGLLVLREDIMAKDKYRGRIVRPIPYDDGSGTRHVAPVGAYEIAERGEHLQFFGEGLDPFDMPRKHALQHHKVGHLEIEDWES